MNNDNNDNSKNLGAPPPKFQRENRVHTPYGEGTVLFSSNPSLFPRGWSRSYTVKIDRTGRREQFMESELKLV